ncbi:MULTISPECIES: ester cyclase [Haloferax]|uniref:Ester cyclase n=1 Tax=Haloferax marinum TaxID=2666143 RepID=A0A6A8G5D9_9EURY|nr:MULTISPECIES: ester cyclase [Haloferax]KAB1196521.1 ester cyclase [Haloferax sp. CBA1150]MRW95523.1 hypothetical protein [Haloferax marinum]
MAATTDQERQNRDSCIRIADELWNKRNYEIVDEEYDPLVEIHANAIEETVGTQAVKDWARMPHDAFSDFHVELFDVTAKDEFVFGRYHMTGTHDGTMRATVGDIPATHRKIDMWGLVEMRFDGGLVVEEWNTTDGVEMLAQLGVTPE